MKEKIEKILQAKNIAAKFLISSRYWTNLGLFLPYFRKLAKGANYFKD